MTARVAELRPDTQGAALVGRGVMGIFFRDKEYQA